MVAPLGWRARRSRVPSRGDSFPHAYQGVDASDQGRQGFNLGRRWLTRLRVHSQAGAGINIVILGTEHLTLGKALDLGRVVDTDRVTRVVQVQGRLIAIAPRALEAGMKAIHTLLPKQ